MKGAIFITMLLMALVNAADKPLVQVKQYDWIGDIFLIYFDLFIINFCTGWFGLVSFFVND
jgi:hypothetical protein